MAGVTVPLGPAVVNLTGVRANDRNLITVTVTAGGVPVNLTGLTPAAQARKKASDAEIAVTAVVEVLDAATGRLAVRWPGDQVFDILAGKDTWSGVWDLQLDSLAEDPVTVVAGSFGAVMDVTRP